jgi:hypothetical protein
VPTQSFLDRFRAIEATVVDRVRRVRVRKVRVGKVRVRMVRVRMVRVIVVRVRDIGEDITPFAMSRNL